MRRCPVIGRIVSDSECDNCTLPDCADCGGGV
jgi:hypothetical protein